MDLKYEWWEFAVVCVCAYLIGCINFARIISHSKNKDITKIGSGNPGTMNMSREFGWKVGVTTFFCDALKGGIPAVIVYFVFRGKTFVGTEIRVSDVARYLVGAFVIIGHVFPLWHNFHGGKGIASTFGLFWLSLATDNPWNLLIGFSVFVLVVIYIYLTEMGSMGSLIGVSGFSVWQGIVFYLRYEKIGALTSAYVISMFALILLINVLTWGAHRENIVRLLRGEEHHTSVKQMLKKKK